MEEKIDPRVLMEMTCVCRRSRRDIAEMGCDVACIPSDAAFWTLSLGDGPEVVLVRHMGDDGRGQVGGGPIWEAWNDPYWSAVLPG